MRSFICQALHLMLNMPQGVDRAELLTYRVSLLSIHCWLGGNTLNCSILFREVSSRCKDSLIEFCQLNNPCLSMTLVQVLFRGQLYRKVIRKHSPLAKPKLCKHRLSTSRDYGESQGQRTHQLQSLEAYQVSLVVGKSKAYTVFQKFLETMSLLFSMREVVGEALLHVFLAQRARQVRIAPSALSGRD